MRLMIEKEMSAVTKMDYKWSRQGKYRASKQIFEYHRLHDLSLMHRSLLFCLFTFFLKKESFSVLTRLKIKNCIDLKILFLIVFSGL